MYRVLFGDGFVPPSAIFNKFYTLSNKLKQKEGKKERKLIWGRARYIFFKAFWRLIWISSKEAIVSDA